MVKPYLPSTYSIISVITYYASSALFAIFGIKMLHEGYHMSPHEGQEEFEEVNEELRKREEVEGRGGSLEQGMSSRKREPSVISFVGKIFLQVWTIFRSGAPL